MIGDRIKELREELGLKQNDLGSMLGLTSQAVSAYETNKAIPTLDICVKLCDIFDVSLDYLACRTKEKYNLNVLNKNELDLVKNVLSIVRNHK
ncbi:helix-turn-helix transcriptional regulator [Clostridium cadaveris]|uniref:helix-turn-helix transcriptional regulator n=1 Tax=Clostridium cadaveris TaxID=1529 RepID=UPI0015B4D05D|nr:helix-turn-helix transcriptional regulator [Clostridium cadaveris]NWK10386.1 helix-turn-helix transcriptional regulator [Clostridium cadaveris]